MLIFERSCVTMKVCPKIYDVTLCDVQHAVQMFKQKYGYNYFLKYKITKSFHSIQMLKWSAIAV